MVRVQISRNGSTPFHFKVSTKDIDIDDSVDESHFEGDVEIDGEITDGGNVFNVKGKIKCRKFFICDRCLKESSEEQLHEFEEEVEAGNIEDDIVDLTELIRDTIIASQPIQNLCKPDCKGLCSVCGADLNEGECGCDRFIIDPRLTALKKFSQQ